LTKVLGVVLCLLGVALGVVCLCSGPEGLAALRTPLGQLGGSPLLALGGGLAFFLGVLALGRPAEPGGNYALPEMILLLSVAAAGALLAATVLGAMRGWNHGTLASLSLGAALETAVAVGFSIRVAMLDKKRKLLFLPGVGATAIVGIVMLVIVTLGVS
jgi:hypothetical protein